MIPYLPGRHRLAVDGVLLAVFLFGCFIFGVLSVRRTTEGALLIAATFCLVLYWVKREGMAGVTLFLAFAALPEGLHVGKVIGPVAIYVYQVAAVLAIGYLIPIVRPRFKDFLLPGMFVLTVLYFTVVGFQMGHDTTMVLHESTTLIEMVIGFVLALLIVYAGYLKFCMRVMVVTLWFSAAMAIFSSLHAIRLAGRAESLEGATGAGQALRIVLSTQTPATAALTALVAASIIGRVRPVTYLAFGPPALIISLLAFSRNTLIAVAVGATVAFFANFGWRALRRSAIVAAVSAGVAALILPGSLFLLQHSEAGSWLSDQFTAFNQRVFGGVSASALATDESTLDRLREVARLNAAIAQAPVFGHGLGYAYQLPSGNDPKAFAWTLGPTYSHLFYQWWLAKAGAVGMAAFAWFALTPIVRALRCATVPAKISAAVCAGLLAISAVWPLPEMPMDALALGLTLGTAMGFAGLRRRNQEAVHADADPAPALVAVGRK
ncbi:O-antigen ligase family protein [Mycobacterium nebraskense]|uniref:Polymerase n=1 Tax=Mycobacterium nebraskense TaxID=244292 RepID=A0A0F5N867_9MYCO|nr:O-antigen ligase family protein [Mycobacterium nebraskense]KKC03055.1 polymerase [Mycobacterium nebraskense]KLO35562.1 polymerase [Mycobacterium nebraskense]MBI2693182.1 O-antigen ligase family protein [Mycobacterium nebraskense]MCV7116961.1 O-antigen ligase family protein [Mycobacterium nebraskense]ORW15857.1 polymerase [Mycobacterium nebraskense]